MTPKRSRASEAGNRSTRESRPRSAARDSRPRSAASDSRPRSAASDSRPRVGVSLCLLGEEVRHDGGHTRDKFVVGVLGKYFDWVSVCPEVEVGMGTPREALRLIRTDDGVHMVTIKTRIDWTERMLEYSRARLDALAEQDLHGFILKKNSPSCGMERVKLYDQNDVPSRDGTGLFAHALMRRFPLLPVEEEGRLNDSALRESFINRVYAYHRWRRQCDTDTSPRGLVDFHTRHKMLLLAHNAGLYYRLGRLVADAGKRPAEDTFAEYGSIFMEALSRPAPVRRHVNVLQHLCGFLKNDLSADEKTELQGVIEDYRRGIVPLVAPLTLLKHHLRAIRHPWVDQQIYLEPYPRDLALRSQL